MLTCTTVHSIPMCLCTYLQIVHAASCCTYRASSHKFRVKVLPTVDLNHLHSEFASLFMHTSHMGMSWGDVNAGHGSGVLCLAWFKRTSASDCCAYMADLTACAKESMARRAYSCGVLWLLETVEVNVLTTPQSAIDSSPSGSIDVSCCTSPSP